MSFVRSFYLYIDIYGFLPLVRYFFLSLVHSLSRYFGGYFFMPVCLSFVI